MDTDSNFIIFCLAEMSEYYFSLAGELIGIIEENDKSKEVCDLISELKNSYDCSWVKFTRRKEEEFYNNKIVNSINRSDKISDETTVGNIKEALDKGGKFYYIFIYNNKKSIRPHLTGFQFFFLIKQKYNRCKLYIYDCQEKTDDYFVISHFLYFQTLKDSETVFYRNKSNSEYRRLQLNNIGVLKRFIPMIEINNEIYGLLSMRICELWDDYGKLNISFSNDVLMKIFNKIWQSCMYFMDKKEDMVRYFKGLDMYNGLSFLSFYILQLYIFNNEKQNVDNETLRFFVLEVVDGILQLVENVCLHSELKKGYLSILIERQENKSDEKLKIEVIDFAKRNDELSKYSVLNYEFAKKIPSESGLKRRYLNAKVKDFFEPVFKADIDEKDEEFYGNYWDEYYNDAENAAFHYGLQLFASIVKGYQGKFYVRSSYVYDCPKENKYFFGEKILNIKNEALCFTGTHYLIEFPMEIENVQKNIGFNSKISDKTFEDILNYSVNRADDSFVNELIQLLSAERPNYQDDKEKKIKIIKNYLKSNENYFVNDKYFITQISFERFVAGQMIEFFCKALFLLVKESENISLKIAINDCQEECVFELVRWFLIFYDKYNICVEMDNVEIYLVGNDSREDFLLSGKSLAISQARVEKVCMSKGVFSQKQKIISQAVWRMVKDDSRYQDENFEIIPYDVLVDYKDGEKIFEDAVLRTLNTDLQSKEFGCKVKNCHVRIGSKIHITDNFYEAHSLFHSNYYTSRFAFLLAKRLSDNILEIQKDELCKKIKNEQLVIIGYETYSELLVCEIKKVLKCSFGFTKVGHLILDAASSDEFRLWNEQYKDAYYVNVVPINSTLSTHNKIISVYQKYKMKEDNILANYAMILIRDSAQEGEKRTVTGNYNDHPFENNISVLEKKYWHGIDVLNKKVYTPLVGCEVDYIILVENNWNWPLECECCYPDKVEKETPLIETNKASVVPTFMLGMKTNSLEERKISLIDLYKREINDLRLSPDIIDYKVLSYAHICRNGNDYRFYINSESLYEKLELLMKDDIGIWYKTVRSVLKYRVPKAYLTDLINSFLRNKKRGKSFELFNSILSELSNMQDDFDKCKALDYLDKIVKRIKGERLDGLNKYLESVNIVKDMVEKIQKDENIQTYDIIVSPVHHSNATWIDQVTESIFDNMPAILHFDIQKEFRDNMKTKYSNLTTLYYNLCSAQRKFEINFHYVDDTIVSGKTFNRAKTLIQSLFPMEAYSSHAGERPKVNLFKSVILLFNRLSKSSKLFYVSEGMFFSYINIYVPNLRNHEDACIMCKLVEEMNKVKRRSATNLLAEMFERKEIKHIRLNEIDYDKSEIKVRKELEAQNYRRLYCNHKIFEKILEIGNLCNETSVMRKNMMLLIVEKLNEKKLSCDEKMEWVISYFKIFSRPVITFRKSILEAYFDIAINFIEFIQGVKNDDNDIMPLFDFYREFFDKSKERKNLLSVLIKTLLGGLGRCKSNYIIRAAKIETIFNWYKINVTDEKKEIKSFENWYVFTVKRMIELSGDETKCLWIEKMLLEGREWGKTMEYKRFFENFGIKTQFGMYLFMENTRLIYDAVSDLYKNFYKNKNEHKLFEEIKKQLEGGEGNFTHYYIYNFFELVKIDLDFCKKNKFYAEEKKACIARIVQMVKLYAYLNKKIELPLNKEAEEVNINTEYTYLLNFMCGASDAVKVILFGADEKEDRLKHVKEIIRKNCEDISEYIENLLQIDDSAKFDLYKIGESNENKESNENEEYKRKEELEYAKNLLDNFETENGDFLRIGRTIVINFEKKCALVKIHNNWKELLEECKKKNINKVHVDPFYLYFEFSNSDKNEIIRGLRNVLTFRDSLVKKIEQDFNNNLIQLTVASQKKAENLSNDRAAGHTKMDEVQSFMNTYIKKDISNCNNALMGNMLKLLADAYCSHKFREFCLKAVKPLEIEDLVSGCDLAEYITNIKNYSNIFDEYVFSVVDSVSKSKLESEIESRLTEEDVDVLCIDFDEVWILFIVLLVQNALEHGWSTGQNAKIKLYIEENNIVVENDVVLSEQRILRIEEMLRRMPEGTDGISLWVMDQCIRDIWRRYYWNKYVTYDCKKETISIASDKIEPLLKKLKKLEEPVISVKRNEESKWLKIMLPIICDEKGDVIL